MTRAPEAGVAVALLNKDVEDRTTEKVVHLPGCPLCGSVARVIFTRSTTLFSCHNPEATCPGRRILHEFGLRREETLDRERVTAAIQAYYARPRARQGPKDWLCSS